MLAGVGPEMERQPQRRVEQHRRQTVVEGDPDPRHEPAAQAFEHPIEGVEQQGEHAEGDERRHAPARQDLVVDQHHEHRSSEHQDIPEAADRADAVEGRAETADCGLKVGLGVVFRPGFHGRRPLRERSVRWRIAPSVNRRQSRQPAKRAWREH